MISQSAWSTFMTTPVLNSLVEITRQHLSSVFCDQHHIFDSDPEFPRQINARLHCNHHARLQNRAASRGHGRRLVDLKAHPMPGAVTKIPAITGLLNGLPAGAVHFTNRYPRARLLDPETLGAPDNLIYFLQ